MAICVRITSLKVAANNNNGQQPLAELLFWLEQQNEKARNVFEYLLREYAIAYYFFIL